MSGSGRTYAVSGETTEWEDILIKKGIRTKEEVLLEKGLNPADVRSESVLQRRRVGNTRTRRAHPSPEAVPPPPPHTHTADGSLLSRKWSLRRS